MSNLNNIDLSQKNNNQDALDEFSQGAVPLSERKGFFSLVFVWIGYVFTVTIMTAGGKIALGSYNLVDAVKAMLLGCIILICIGCIIAFISKETGLTFGLLSRYTFGNLGSQIVALSVMVTLLGWFSINCYLIGSVTNALYPSIPIIPVSIIAGICMTFTALKGVEVMNKLGTVATVLVVALGIVSIFLAIRDAGGAQSLLAITQPNPLPFNDIVTVAVGSVVCGAVAWTPDIMRFAKNKKTAFSVMAISLGFCAPFMLMIGIIGMLVYGQSDIAYILKAQGLLGGAWFALVANVWSTAQGNVYSSSLNLANTFRKIPRKYLVIAFGGIGTLAGLLGLYQHFSSWLSFLASTFPALGGVIIADYIFTYNRKYPDLEVVESSYPKINWISFVSFAAGVLVNYKISWGISTINAVLAAFIVQGIFSITVLKNKFTLLQNERDSVNNVSSSS